MTIASTTTKQIMNGDGVTRSWPFTFHAWEDEVRVIVADAAGIETDATADSVITLDPGGDGGTVAYPAASASPALPAGRRIVVMRDMDLVQETRLVNVTRFDPAVIENQLDRLIANDQQQQEQIDRALSVGVASGRDPGAVIEEVFQARDRAETAATGAAASAIEAAGSATAAADSATSAQDWAEKAQDVVVSNGPIASPTQKGIVPAGGTAGQVYRTNAAGTAYGWENFPEVAFATTAETMTGTVTNKATTPAGVKAAVDAVKQTRGAFKWSMFAPDELADNEPGWYFMGGQGYAVGSPQAAELLKLPAAFRTRWGITNDGTNVHMPNMFYSDGRGYVIRASDGTTRQLGSVQLDAFQAHLRRIVRGDVTNGGSGDQQTSIAGVTGGAGAAGFGGSNTPTSTYYTWDYYKQGSNGTPRTANETRSLNIGMTPVMYLGV